MDNAVSFPPSWRADARVLVLGSMPGQASLKEQRYYAHPRNAFWPILGELCGFSPELTYTERLLALNESGVALWDVIGSCHRPGSLDSRIAAESVQPNDLPGLVSQLPELRLIACNGGTAYRLFTRHFGSLVGAEHPDRPAVLQLPSTSPAYAAMSFDLKRERWRAILEYMAKSES